MLAPFNPSVWFTTPLRHLEAIAGTFLAGFEGLEEWERNEHVLRVQKLPPLPPLR